MRFAAAQIILMKINNHHYLEQSLGLDSFVWDSMNSSQSQKEHVNQFLNSPLFQYFSSSLSETLQTTNYSWRIFSLKPNIRLEPLRLQTIISVSVSGGVILVLKWQRVGMDL